MARMATSEERIPCPSVLFRCSDRPFGEPADLGWSNYLPNLHVVTLPGDHNNVMQVQNAEQIFTQISATISEEDGVLPIPQVTCS